MKAHYKRLKADQEKWQLHLNKEKDRDKQRPFRKLKEDEDGQLLAERRKNVLDRVRKNRKKLKAPVENEQISPLGSYEYPQSLGRAVKRLKRNLPDSPSKKIAVVKKLALEMGSKTMTI